MVIFIILIVSVVALPVVLPAMSHREVRETARLVQGTLVGARDSAIHNNQPSGIRLLPDPNLITITNGVVDAGQILACNRIIPIDPAPEYSEGLCTPVTLTNMNYLGTHTTQTEGLPAPTNWPTKVPYPVVVPGTNSYYPTPLVAFNQSGVPTTFQPGQVLMLIENVVEPYKKPAIPNPPTSWHWNIRVGDRLQLNNAGPWYTVVGPMTVTPAGGNPEMFVNTSVPGDFQYLPVFSGKPAEYLLLVNGQDDNKNGWTDEGWDGVDNDGDGYVDGNPSVPSTTVHTEWELEQWLGSIPNQLTVNLPYAIQRRPVPSSNAREIALPTNVVIDLTGWGYPSPERSRIPGPMFNQFTGYVDIVLNPDGTVRPTTLYSSPSSFGMSATFLHLWLAERTDLAAPSNSQPAVRGVSPPPHLPLPQGLAPVLFKGQPAPFAGQELKGEYSLITLFTRTGQILLSENMPFLYNSGGGGFTNNPPVGPGALADYSPNYPFIQVQQGLQGGSQ